MLSEGLEPSCQKHWFLKPTCLPISPGKLDLIKNVLLRDSKLESGRRDLNTRPQPWQGCALPTELRPHIYRTWH